MKLVKALALALAALMLLLPLAGCGAGGKEEDEDPGVNVVVDTKEDDKSAVYDAEIHDMHGHEFWFIVGTTTVTHLNTNEVYAEELNGDKINDAVFKRNSVLQEKYNCKILEERNAEPAKAVKEQLIAGEYQYDYIYTGISSLRPLSAAGLLCDFYSLDQIDLDKSWWDRNMIDGLAIAGKAFYVNGDAGTLDDRASWIMFFNKDVIDKYHLESPYELVRAGKWTVDKMVEYMIATADDLNGDGVMEIGVDRFGYTGERLNNWYHVAACNARLSLVSKNGDINIPGSVNEDVLRAWAKLRPLLTSKVRVAADAGGGNRFRNGLATFFACNAGIVTTLSNVNFGVLPMPKYDEEQEEYWTSIHSGWTYGYAIPTVTDSATDYAENGFASGREQAAYFLEAFAYHSVDTLTVAYYEQVVKHQAVRDDDSGEMMDIALKNKLYDPVVIFNFGSIGTTLFQQAGSELGGATAAVGSDANYDTLVSTYESRVEAARKALNRYVDFISEDDN